MGSQVNAANKFKLKAGARGKICVTCHDGFEEVLKKRYLHTPVEDGDCAGCHSPHTSNFDKFLSADAEHICYECHDQEDIIPSDALSEHRVVLEGKCLSCHDPHSSDNENNLKAAGSKLCFECHKELGAKIGSYKVAHKPVTKSCLECHNPHASTKSVKLLKKAVPGLCVGCHKTDKSSFKSLHKNFPVQEANCVQCHSPHGSNTERILYDNVHKPVSQGKCNECHEGVESATPFKLKDPGYKLCEGCHYDEVVDIFNQNRVHWPILDKKGCINCHAPHGSPQESLLKKPMLELCGSCHSDTIARQERSETKHPPIEDGECTECHSPHGSDVIFIFNEPKVIDVCGTCHDWEAHSTHPIGEKVIDPRNNNLRLQCLSCHRAHGTEYKHFLYFETTNEMCVQCHVDLRR